MDRMILLCVSFLFCFRRLLRYLHYYQQEEYLSGRFCSWIVENKAFDRKGSICLFAGFLASFFSNWLTMLGVSIALLTLYFFEPDPRKEGKKLLNMTDRAKNIFILSIGLLGMSMLALLVKPNFIWIGLFLLFQGLPLFLVTSNSLLWPFEKKKQNKFIQEAKALLLEASPCVIGITGSYGKTSTKDALGKILQITLGPTFWPPKSINTPMGITREIRERLVKGYEYAIIEMGAYHIGSIQKLCELTPPHCAIVTGVGAAHLNRFGSKENIYLAKSELPQALPKNGILVCNGDNEGARKMASSVSFQKTFLYGFDQSKGDLDCWASEWNISIEGTAFTLEWQGKIFKSKTPLLGPTALSNVLGAFTMACALGADPEFVLAVIATLEPVDNRLQVSKESDIFYIHDAYNSNPVGFAAAVEVAKALPGKRRLMMTPGMIELGGLQFEENERMAAMAGQCFNMAFIVGKTNQEALEKGFRKGGISFENLYFCDTRQAAFNKIADMRKNGDIILIENDLTDIYETKLKF